VQGWQQQQRQGPTHSSSLSTKCTAGGGEGVESAGGRRPASRADAPAAQRKGACGRRQRRSIPPLYSKPRGQHFAPPPPPPPPPQQQQQGKQRSKAGADQLDEGLREHCFCLLGSLLYIYIYKELLLLVTWESRKGAI
jgi:hypothetical protein